MKTKVFYSHQFACIRREMTDRGAIAATSRFPYEIEFIGDGTAGLREYARKLAKSCDAEVEITANATNSALSDYSFRPKPLNVQIQPLSDTAEFLALALPDYSSRNDVAEMNDAFVAEEKATDKYGSDSQIALKKKRNAEKLEDALLLEALKAALASGRLLWKGVGSI